MDVVILLRKADINSISSKILKVSVQHTRRIGHINNITYEIDVVVSYSVRIKSSVMNIKIKDGVKLITVRYACFLSTSVTPLRNIGNGVVVTSDKSLTVSWYVVIIGQN